MVAPGQGGNLNLIGRDGTHGHGETAARVGVEEGDCEWCAPVDVDVAQASACEVAYIGMETRHHLLHELLGAELQNLVGHVHLVDGVVVAVESGGGGLVRGVLDDYLSLRMVDERRSGPAIPREGAAHGQRQEEPGPPRQQILQHVENVEFRVFCTIGLHLSSSQKLVYNIFFLSNPAG